MIYISSNESKRSLSVLHSKQVLASSLGRYTRPWLKAKDEDPGVLVG